MDSQIPDFRSFTPAQRLEAIALKAGLDAEDVRRLSRPGALPLETANGMIENVLGTFELPYAVAGYFRINGTDVLVPMAVEEPSVVAAASHMAKIARGYGGFQTSSTGPIMRAQIQVLGIADPFGARHAILLHRQEIIDHANSRDRVLTELGGGCKDIEVHVFPDTARGAMVIVHLLVDVRDAMGANTVNTMAEAVAGSVVGVADARLPMVSRRRLATFSAAARIGSSSVCTYVMNCVTVLCAVRAIPTLMGTPELAMSVAARWRMPCVPTCGTLARSRMRFQEL